MRVKPEQTPDSYNTLEVVESYDFDHVEKSIDVNKCTDDAGNVYFHVVYQPPVSQIESPGDISTLTSFTVGSDETVEDVKRQADNSAREHYADMDT